MSKLDYFLIAVIVIASIASFLVGSSMSPAKKEEATQQEKQLGRLAGYCLEQKQVVQCINIYDERGRELSCMCASP